MTTKLLKLISREAFVMVVFDHNEACHYQKDGNASQVKTIEKNLIISYAKYK